MRRLREALAAAQVALEGHEMYEEAELWSLDLGLEFWTGNYDSSTVFEVN